MEEAMILKRLQDKQLQRQKEPVKEVEQTPSAFQYYITSLQQLST